LRQPPTEVSHYDKEDVEDQQPNCRGSGRPRHAAVVSLRIAVPKLRNLPPNAKIVVYGHTDNLPVGPGLQQQGIPDNLVLSTRRAADVVTYLISQGVPAASISAKGFGDTRPVASNDTPQGRAQNRRIEITIQGPG